MSSDFRLTAGQRRTLGAISRVACPDDVEALGCEGRLVSEVELTLASFPPLLRQALAVTLVLFEWLAVLRPSSLGRRFSGLPRARQERYFAAWWHSPLLVVRQAIKAIKGLLGMAYYDLPAVKARLEYFPEAWMAQVKQQRLDRFGDEIREQDRLVTAPDPLVPAAALSRRGTRVDAT